MIMDRHSGRINLRLLVIGLLALIVPIALALQLGSQATQATPSTAGCPSCSQQSKASPSVDPADTLRWQHKTATWKLYVQPYSDGEAPTFYDANFRRLNSESVRQLFVDLPKDNRSSIDLAILQPLPHNYDNGLVRPRFDFRVGCYYVRVSWERHPIYSCINRNVWHLGFILKNTCTGQDISNLHACVWWQNGPQFGLYDSFRVWCVQTRGQWTNVRDAVAGFLGGFGIGYVTRMVMADIAADIVVVTFGL